MLEITLSCLYFSEITPLGLRELTTPLLMIVILDAARAIDK